MSVAKNQNVAYISVDQDSKQFKNIRYIISKCEKYVNNINMINK